MCVGGGKRRREIGDGREVDCSERCLCCAVLTEWSGDGRGSVCLPGSLARAVQGDQSGVVHAGWTHLESEALPSSAALLRALLTAIGGEEKV